MVEVLELSFTTKELEWLCWVNELPIHKLLSKLMVDYRIKVDWIK